MIAYSSDVLVVLENQQNYAILWLSHKIFQICNSISQR